MKRGAARLTRPLLLTAALILIAGVLSSVISGGLNTLLEPLSEWTASLTRTAPSEEELSGELEKLREENAVLKKELAEYAELKEENDRLRQLFGVVKEQPSLTLKPAAVLRRDAGDDHAAFTLGVGSSDGVSQGDPVVTARGLIGRVTRVDSATCKVATVLSPEVHVGVTDKRTGDCGVLSGTAALSDEGLTELGLLEDSHTVRAGDLLYTSGDGGAYPKNLYVGKAAEAARNSVTVEPCEDCFAVDFAAVVTDFAGKGEVHVE